MRGCPDRCERVIVMKSVFRPVFIGRQIGLSLIELLISIALGLLILLGVISIFSASSANYRFQQSSSAVQESGRIALEVMARDIRMTGFSGCSNVNYIINHTSAVFSNQVALSGGHNVNPLTPDTITLVRASEGLTTIAPGTQAVGTTVPVLDILALGLPNPPAGSRILLTNCQVTEVGVVASVAGNVITLANALVGSYSDTVPSRVLRHESVEYRVVGDELQRSINGGAFQALISNVQNLKFTYGINTDVIGSVGYGSVNEYIVDPGAVAPVRWGDVVAVNVNLTLTANNELTETFGTTVALRNRAP